MAPPTTLPQVKRWGYEGAVGKLVAPHQRPASSILNTRLFNPSHQASIVIFYQPHILTCRLVALAAFQRMSCQLEDQRLESPGFLSLPLGLPGQLRNRI